MLIRRAAIADVPELMKLRIEAEEWLAAAGVDQWRDSATRTRALAKWHADIHAGRTYVVQNAGDALLGTVTLAEADVDFWRAADHPQDAFYVAKLITARAAKGTNLGGRILDWVGRRAAAAQRPWIRLDVWRTNEVLQNYYLAQQFTHVRTESPAHRLSGWMAQRPSNIVMYPHAPLIDREANPQMQHEAHTADHTTRMSNGYERKALLRDSRRRFAFRNGENSAQARGAFDIESRMSGTTPRAEVSVRRDAPPADIAVILDTLEPVIVRDQQLYRDDQLVQLSISYIPAYVAEVAPAVESVDSGRGGIKTRMDEAGLRQHTAVEDITLVPATAAQAASFGVEEEWPLATITHTARLGDGRIVEVTVHTLSPGWSLRYEVPLSTQL
ncbi:UTRA domain-containing protein [Streptomyces lavendulae]|uniref:UTRA domain-containing protein n=1 Tax=Streptomyces lavendulae TaxID=1914 RepID=UPI003403793A